MATYLIFGASITYGAWDTEKGGWVQRLRSFIEEKNKMEDIVYNLGVSGDTTNYLLERFESETKNRIEKGEPTIFIFSIDLNDSAKFNESRYLVEAEEFKKNLAHLTNLAKKYSEKVVFIGLTLVDEAKTVPVPWNKNVSYYNQDVIKYNEILKTFCQENKLLFIDIINTLKVEDLEDGVHPNSKGHEQMFEIIKDSLIKNKII